MSAVPARHPQTIQVLAKPGSRHNEVERREDGVLIVRVTQRAVDGKANEAIRKVLAKEFGCRPSNVVIKSGLTSKHKRVEITG